MSANRQGPPTEPLGPGDSMRRLQIGIAGVMGVLLLVGLAGLIGDRAREQVASEGAAAALPAQNVQGEKAVGTPLEELGVQPVTKSGDTVAPPPVVQTLPPSTAKVPDLEPDPELERARSKSTK
ncbi:MAG TPA: hypothetical protein PKD99_17340 [Sphingopyxis sp.]|nr:hypothetical protein [Sphingopyxis sp.]HMP46864.1 hypothetical protein [Sphingopyxis sp.]HMQ19564.1 hypothetical protein [Sphingopyxis sp.]